MAFWSQSNRTDIDNVVRQRDRTLNVLVIVLLAAFTLVFGAYRYGQLSQIANANVAVTAPQSAPAATR